MLIVGAGVIGTVYGAHLAAAGAAVVLLRHGPRTDQVARDGLTARDLTTGNLTRGAAAIVADAATGQYDLVLVAVRSDQLSAACVPLADLAGSPAVVFFGNNAEGRSAISSRVRGEVMLGFPGVGGALRGGAAEYARIPQQPTALQAVCEPRLDEFARMLGTRGFAALSRMGVTGLPRNLAVLHSRLLTAVAVRYWARTMRSPMGELCFAAHSRHAEAEMHALGEQMTCRLGDMPGTSHLRRLLAPAPADSARAS